MATKSTWPRLRRQLLVGLAEFLGDERAVRGAHGVEEGQRDDVAAEAGQADRAAVLVDEVEAAALARRWRWACRRAPR